ncbi:hypothetical protein EV363DRAFT_1291949 [Boletus edulis]|nr:hypothetical protein EV363DRAFT_1291949 [Boletus edulis]
MYKAYLTICRGENGFDNFGSDASESDFGQQRECNEIETSSPRTPSCRGDEVTSSNFVHHTNIAVANSDKPLESQDIATGSVANRPSLKRRRSGESKFPMTPRRAASSSGGALNNLSLSPVGRATSVPTMGLRPEKRRRLRSLFDAFGPSQPRIPKRSENDTENTLVFEELNQTLRKQTKILAEILEVLREKGANCQ